MIGHHTENPCIETLQRQYSSTASKAAITMPVWVQVGNPVAPFLTHLPANLPRKATQYGPGA